MENTKKTITEEKRIIEQRASSLKSIVGLGLSIEDCRRFVSGILNEAAELYSSQFKQSEPVSADVEQAAKELYPIPFPDKFSNMNQEAIKERLAFIAGAKRQSQQPVSIQWLSEEEIDKLIEAIWNKSHLTTRKLDFIDCKKLSEFIQSQLQSRVNSVDPVEFVKHCIKSSNGVTLSDEYIQNQLNSIISITK